MPRRSALGNDKGLCPSGLALWGRAAQNKGAAQAWERSVTAAPSAASHPAAKPSLSFPLPETTELKILLYSYLVLYSLFLIWTLVEAFQAEEPWWDVASDVILLPLGGVGMVLFVVSVETPIIKSAWKVFSIAIIVGQLITLLVSRHRTLSGQDDIDPKTISQWTILGADLTTVVFMAPMVFLNLKYAFS